MTRATGSYRTLRVIVGGEAKWEVTNPHGFRHGRELYDTEDHAIVAASKLNRKRLDSPDSVFRHLDLTERLDGAA